jgi:hypothetical protein
LLLVGDGIQLGDERQLILKGELEIEIREDEGIRGDFMRLWSSKQVSPWCPNFECDPAKIDLPRGNGLTNTISHDCPPTIKD